MTKDQREIQRKWPCRVVAGQYLSTGYTERLSEAGFGPSVAGVGDAYGNTRAETINVRYKTELVDRLGRWRHMQDMEKATFSWVDWLNNRRPHGPIGNIPPAVAEENSYAKCVVLDMVA